MANLDWKHLVAVLVGIVLSVLASQFGLDFSKSCPAVPVAPAAVVSPVVAK